LLNLIAWILVSVAGVYIVIGVIFALFFVGLGVKRIDPAAEEGTIGFRVLIFPGAVALWPLLMRRSRERTPPPVERNAHRDVARGAEGDSGATHPVAPGGAR